MKEKNNKSKDAIKNYLDDFIDSDFFQHQILVLRKKFNIPKKGFPIRREGKNRIINYRRDFDGPAKLNKISGKISTAIYKIIDNLPIDGFELHAILKLYLIYNIKFLELWDFVFKEDNFNLIKITDWKKEIHSLEEYYYNYVNKSGEKLFDILERESKNYPIILRINPHVSRNALIEYIKKNWSQYIATSLSSYKSNDSRLGKLRNKDEQRKKMYSFIYKNKHKSYSDLSSMVANKFPREISNAINEGSVGKIISLEKKRRK